MAITAAEVKKLRETTGAGMMDCKKALTATEGDMDKAIEWLREKGLATAQKKASRVAAEGLCKVLVSEDAKKAVVVEVFAVLQRFMRKMVLWLLTLIWAARSAFWWTWRPM